MLLTSLLLIAIQAPASEVPGEVGLEGLASAAEATSGAPEAPPNIPLVTAARVQLEQPVLVHFAVPTSAGTLKGTVRMTRLDIRGLTTRGALDVRGRIDPSSISTGDPVADAHIARAVLKAARGDIVFGATKRLTADGNGKPATGFGLFMDGQRSGRYREVFFDLVPETADRMRLKMRHKATGAELGLSDHLHPFVEVTGPVVLSFDAPLVAAR